MPDVPQERETPDEIPFREVVHQGESLWSGDFDYMIGDARTWRHERTITKAERDKWRKEDADRDGRRIPLGFRAPDDDTKS